MRVLFFAMPLATVAAAFVTPAGAAALPVCGGQRLLCAQRPSPRQLKGAPLARMVRASVPLVVEAPRPLVFALFSDLERMPEWSSTLESVKRVPNAPDTTDWRFSWRGVRLGWQARDTDRIEERRIAWTATSGVIHDGCVDFEDAGTEGGTSVTMSVEFDAGVLSGILDSRILGPGIMRFVEGALESDLQRFRQYVLRVQRRERIAKQRGGTS